jgi:hypothetical protein
MINHNRFKNKSLKRGQSSDLYCPDKEEHPLQWQSILYNDQIDILTHVKPVKLTQKKIKDFLIKEKITNENKNIPTELMNFLYSSITENDYHVNFINIL